LRHNAADRKVARSIASSRTQPLTEMRRRNLFEDKVWPEHEADNLNAIFEGIA
jgi:hypothetical protein